MVLWNHRFPSEALDADIFLFHPWDAFAGMKEHVLAKIDFFDETQTETFQRILAPNETIQFRLSEILPGTNGASGLYVETYHPRLIGRRNHRWRVWADVLTERSLTSLHGSHDDGTATARSQFIVDMAPSHTDRLTITLPNYTSYLPETRACPLQDRHP